MKKSCKHIDVTNPETVKPYIRECLCRHKKRGAILHHLLDNRYIQSLLRGMKPCVTGIVLATGLYMTFQHCLGQGKQPQQAFQALFVILGLILGKRGYQRAMKKKLSPVGLILASAVLGVIVYGG